jgi:predicted AAA+ superfamily ATPase
MIQRHIADKVLQLATQFPVISVTGPRQSGKTTLVKQLFPDYAYVNLENPDARFAAQRSPKSLLDHGKRGIVIDEAQYLPEIFSH